MAKKAQKTKKTYKYLTKAVQFPDGSRKYFRGKTQEELDEKVLKAQILMKSGVDICSEETFAHFAQMWYDLYKKPYLRKNSLNSIKYVLNDHILPYIGSYRLRDITPMQIQSIIVSPSGKSNSLQSKVLVAMRNIFNVAQENGLIVRSPVSSMLKPHGENHSREKDADCGGKSAPFEQGTEYPGQNLSADSPPYRNAAGRNPWPPVEGHRLQGEGDPCPAQCDSQQGRNHGF